MHLHVPNNSTKILSVDGFLNYLNTRIKYLKKVEITQYTTVNKTAKTIINKLQSRPLDVARCYCTVLVGPICHWTRNASAHYMPTDARVVPIFCAVWVVGL